jgi:hypothetical protein
MWDTQLITREKETSILEETTTTVDTLSSRSHKKQNRITTFPTQSIATTGLMRSLTLALISIRTRKTQPRAFKEKKIIEKKKEENKPKNMKADPNRTIWNAVQDRNWEREKFIFYFFCL